MKFEKGWETTIRAPFLSKFKSFTQISVPHPSESHMDLLSRKRKKEFVVGKCLPSLSLSLPLKQEETLKVNTFARKRKKGTGPPWENTHFFLFRVFPFLPCYGFGASASTLGPGSRSRSQLGRAHRWWEERFGWCVLVAGRKRWCLGVTNSDWICRLTSCTTHERVQWIECTAPSFLHPKDRVARVFHTVLIGRRLSLDRVVLYRSSPTRVLLLLGKADA